MGGHKGLPEAVPLGKGSSNGHQKQSNRSRCRDCAGFCRRRPGVCVQVNIGDEPQKGGCPIAQTGDLILHDTLISKNALHRVVGPLVAVYSDVATLVVANTRSL